MLPADILISMACDGAIFARDPTIGLFHLKAPAGDGSFASASVNSTNIQYLTGVDLVSAATTSPEGPIVYVLTAEARRHGRALSHDKQKTLAAPQVYRTKVIARP